MSVLDFRACGGVKGVSRLLVMQMGRDKEHVAGVMFSEPGLVNSLLLGDLAEHNVFWGPFEGLAGRTQTLNEVLGPIAVVDVEIDNCYSFHGFSVDVEQVGGGYSNVVEETKAVGFVFSKHRVSLLYLFELFLGNIDSPINTCMMSWRSDRTKGILILTFEHSPTSLHHCPYRSNRRGPAFHG